MRLAKIDGRPCRVCDRGPVEYHHIVPRSKFGARDDEVSSAHNAMPLCHGCHQDHHTTDRRVPRHLLTDDEWAFALGRMGHGWLDKWYPETEEVPA